MIMLLASPWTYGIYVFLPDDRLINCRFHLFYLQLPTLALNVFCFSNHQGVCSSSSYPFSLLSSVLHEKGNFFLEYIQSNWHFLRSLLLRSVLSSPIRPRASSLTAFSDHFDFSILLEHHISKLVRNINNSRINRFHIILKLMSIDRLELADIHGSIYGRA